jgi:hypothetical protein
MLSLQGIFQIKYLYAEHIYEWGAEQVGGNWKLTDYQIDLFYLAAKLLYHVYGRRSGCPSAVYHAA